MKQEIQTNLYDDLLIRVEEADPGIQIKDFKTITAHEDGDERVRIFVANPKPFRFYCGYEINVPTLSLYLYAPVQNCVKFGYSLSEQNAVLYALGRILANYGHRLSETINHDIKAAIFQHRQLSIFG